jgi:hypothetical protein
VAAIAPAPTSPAYPQAQPGYGQPQRAMGSAPTRCWTTSGCGYGTPAPQIAAHPPDRAGPSLHRPAAAAAAATLRSLAQSECPRRAARTGRRRVADAGRGSRWSPVATAVR